MVMSYDDSSTMNVEAPAADYRHASIEELGTAFISITDQIEKLMAEREQIRKVFNEKHGNAYAQVEQRDSKFMSRTGIGYQDQPTEMAVDPRRY